MIGIFAKGTCISHPKAVIAVQPAIIYSFVKRVRKQGERVNTSVKTMQNDSFTSSIDIKPITATGIILQNLGLQKNLNSNLHLIQATLKFCLAGAVACLSKY